MSVSISDRIVFRLFESTVNTEIKVTLIPQNVFLCFRFRIDIMWTDDLLHSCPHRYFTRNYTFAFTFVTLKAINSEIILFCFAIISVSMVINYFASRMFNVM